MATAVQPPCNEAAARGAERERGYRSERGTLVATILGSSLAFVVGSIVNVALPAMQASFDIGAAGAQWIINAYLLPVAALVLIGGALGDHYGRRRFFEIGLIAFSAGSLGAALAPSFPLLIAARVLEGVGAALIAPNSLAIIAGAFSGEKRGKAVGIWAAAGALAGAAAPLAGGLIIDSLGWRWAFGSVVPFAIAAWIVGRRSIMESREDEGERSSLDYAGAALATFGLGALVFALIRLPEAGAGDALVVALGGAGIVALAAFLWVEGAKKERAMMPLGLFATASFSGISLLTLFLYAALGGLLVLLPYVLIEAQGYGATAAGAAILPFPLIMGLLSPKIGGLATRIGIRRVLTAGPLVVAGGFAWLGFGADGGIDYWRGVLPALVLIALGMAFSVAPLTTAVMNSVEQAFVGIASGVNNAVARTAGLVATALLGFVLSVEADDALLRGFGNAAWIGAVLCIASGIAALALLSEAEVAGERDR